MTKIIKNSEIKTNINIGSAPEYIPAGPALYSHPAAHQANVERNLAALKDVRSFRESFDPPRSKNGNKIPVKFVAATAAIALGAAGAGIKRVQEVQAPASSSSNRPAVNVMESVNSVEARTSIAWDQTTAAQRHDAQVKSGVIQPEP